MAIVHSHFIHTSFTDHSRVKQSQPIARRELASPILVIYIINRADFY